jgi:hypothetical protein
VVCSEFPLPPRNVILQTQEFPLPPRNVILQTQTCFKLRAP